VLLKPKPADILFVSILAGMLLVACDFMGTRSCPAALVMNCVTINGSTTIDSQFTVYRSHKGVIDASHSSHFRGCFIPITGSLTYFVMRGDSLVAQTQVKAERSADGCETTHPAVNFDIPEQ
jgi:hypothetical protein